MTNRTLLLLVGSAAFQIIALPRLNAAPAATPPAFGWPTNMASYRITAGRDLDPAATNRADWTGWRSTDPTGGNGHAYDGHGGTDIGTPTGTSILATAAGTVSSLRESVPNDDHSDTGNYLILNNNVGGRNYQVSYWHLSQNGVIPSGTGAAVTKGQTVAQSDNTGNSTGPHLHYEIELAGENSTCAFYHAWWEQDEFYHSDGYPCLVYLDIPTADTNCREGTSTGYNIITSWPANSKAVGIQQNGWWRVFLPLPPAKVFESRTAAGGLAPGYTEAGSWSDNAARSTVSEPAGDANRTTFAGTGSRSSTFGATGDAADVATFAFTAPYQRGDYDLYATWPGDANAANVTFRVTSSNGTQDVVLDQTPADASSAGTGTKADPYRIRTNPYIVNHTTIGAPDEWNGYSPAGNGISEAGPERLYRFDLTRTCDVTIDVTHTSYPTLDIDLHLLNAAAPTSCIARGDFTVSGTNLAPGTYYIAADSYGSNSTATAYTMRVEFNDPQPFANAWVKLGTFLYTPGATGSVQIRESSVTGRVNGSLPAKLCADAIKLVPRITKRSGWVSNTLATRINMSSNPVPSVVVKTDKTAYLDSDVLEQFVEVPIYSAAGVGTSNSNPIVAKAVTGQRFVQIGRSGDWYQVQLTNGTSAASGWILGDHLIGYRQNLISEVPDWALY